MRIHLCAAFILVFAVPVVWAAEPPPRSPETLLGPAPPYVPRATDYSIESGLMTNRDDLFWVSGILGKHLGRCILTESETCQQYIDFHIGTGVREAETQGHFLTSVRWQYVNFPSRHSPYFRLLGGVASVQRPEFRGWRGVGGAGLGIVTYLHEKVDVRLEVRDITLDRSYLQVLIGFNFKVDRLLETFALKLRDFGVGTVETAIKATGTVIKATGEGVGGIVEGVSAPLRPKASPAPDSKSK